MNKSLFQNKGNTCKIIVLKGLLDIMKMVGRASGILISIGGKLAISNLCNII